MKKSIVLSIVNVLVISGAAFAAQPYTTKKAPKLLKAQSPTVVVKDVQVDRTTIKNDEVEFIEQAAEVQQPLTQTTSKAEKKISESTPSLSSEAYVPSAKQLRKIKRAEKKLDKLEKTGERGKSAIISVLLWWFVGFLGVHRFYMGYIGIGILQLLTLGGFGIWWLIDGIFLITGNLQPKNEPFEKSLEDEFDDMF